MAKHLHRLGGFSIRHRRAVVAGWLLVVVAMGVLSAAFSKPFADQFKIPGTESQRAIELIESRTPGANADGATGRVVFAAPAGERLTSGAARTAVAGAAKRLGTLPQVAQAPDPFQAGTVSQDGRIAYVPVQFAVAEENLDESTLVKIEETGHEASRAAGLQVELGGAAAPQESEPPIGEILGVLVALIVLSVTFRAFLPAGLPLLTAGIGVGVGILGIQLASAVTTISSTSITLAAMLGLAVGIDYTLFILSRHRTQVRDGMAIETSIAKAVGTAGSAVVFAGGTVVIALLALAVTGIPFLTQMGIAAAGTIALAVALSLTFVPALLAMAGPRALRGKTFSGHLPGPDSAEKPTMGARWIALVMRRKVAAIGLVVVALAALAIPMLDMRLGLPDDGTANPDTTERRAYDLLATGFGPGFNGPLTVVAEVAKGENAERAGAAVATRLKGMDDVVAVSPPQLNPAKDLAILQVTPASGPSSEATSDLVTAIRDDAGALKEQTGAAVAVTGQTATNIDVSEKMSGALAPYLAVVVGLALVLLLLAFRSILVPVTAIGGFLLTILASFGAVVAVFQQGFLASLIGVATEGPIISLLPVLIIGVIFGLAMDYQVFLVSRMREEFTHGADARHAVRDGFRHGARVVTAAALIMVSVFAGFILPDDPIIKSIGFAFAIGILIDAFLIRMTLIPALMTLLGARAWWLPRGLDRVVPNVDIEGAALESEERPAPAPATRPATAEPVSTLRP